MTTSCCKQVPIDLAAYEAARASEPEFYRAGDSMLYGVRCCMCCMCTLCLPVSEVCECWLSDRSVRTASMCSMHAARGMGSAACRLWVAGVSDGAGTFQHMVHFELATCTPC